LNIGEVATRLNLAAYRQSNYERAGRL
jgi:hypothetical protein